jgi:hypothetical protein
LGAAIILIGAGLIIKRQYIDANYWYILCIFINN